jgi:hypothetical protein
LEIKHLGSNAIVRINMQHPFYTEVYSKLIAAEKQEEDQQKKELSRLVRNGIDLLIVGYARAEGQYEDSSIFDGLRLVMHSAAKWEPLSFCVRLP